jgi:hypothetical protein
MSKNVNIWEIKDHNDPAYVGQVPVLACPEDLTRHRRVVYSVDGRNQIPWPHNVVNKPNADSRLGSTGENK